MPNLFCGTCDGDGLVHAMYENKEQLTIHRHLISCPKCNKHGEASLFAKQGETFISPESIPELLEKGYHYA